MEYNILINKEEITHRIDLLTHYHADKEKRNDLNADVGETSCEDEEILETFLQKAINELIASQTERLKNISYKINNDYIEIHFIGSDERRSNILPILKQTITDYLVNELMAQWLLIRYPAWGQSYIAMRNDLYAQVKELFSCFCKRKIRRRPTNLAGI